MKLLISLNYFCKSICKIMELKLQVGVKIYENNMKLKLEMFKLTQTSHQMIAGIFANMLQGYKN